MTVKTKHVEAFEQARMSMELQEFQTEAARRYRDEWLKQQDESLNVLQIRFLATDLNEQGFDDDLANLEHIINTLNENLVS